MNTRGQAETSQLRANLECQLDRLVAQLADLEDCKNDLDIDEYEETKKETIEQLQEFNDSLAKLKKGDITLIDEISSFQLAIQAAISDAFRTPEIIRLFAKKQPTQLRLKLADIERDHKIGTLSNDSYDLQKTEILAALQRLGDKLSNDEKHFLQNNTSDSLREFSRIQQQET
ncbi:LZIC-like protein, partial [Euroglyphus maynei]